MVPMVPMVPVVPVNILVPVEFLVPVVPVNILIPMNILELVEVSLFWIARINLRHHPTYIQSSRL